MLQLLLCLAVQGAPDAVFLDHSAEITALQDSGYIEYTREVIVPLTGRGVERYRLMSITYREGWETVEVLAARTGHWRSGRGSQAADFREIPHRSLLADGRLETSLRELIVSFQGLETGDTIYLEVRREIDVLPVGDFYGYSFYCGGSDSVDSSTLTLNWPLARPLFTAESEGFSATLTESIGEDARIIRWTCGPESPSPYHFLAPGIRETAPGITIAGSTPEEVSRGFARSMDVIPHSEDSRAVADSILAVSGTDPESICNWISTEIDYLGTDWGDYPGFTPRTPLETLAYRSGVCRDNALMLVWLLRRAGWEADLVMTSSSGIPGDLVGSRSFDHMLVRASVDGAHIFLDATAAGSAGGLSSVYRGLRYLALTDPGSGLDFFPDPLFGDTLDIRLEGELDLLTGMIEGSIHIRLTGAAEDLYRSMLRRTSPDSWPELLDLLSGALPGSGSWDIPDPDDSASPFHITGTCSWSVAVLRLAGGTAVCLPGLQEVSLTGTRTAALLLPVSLSGHGIRLQTPVMEFLDMTLTGFDGSLTGAGTDSSGCWTRYVSGPSPGYLHLREECLLAPARPGPLTTEGILDGLRARCDESLKAVIIR